MGLEIRARVCPQASTVPPTPERVRRISREPGAAETAQNVAAIADGLAARSLYRQAAERYGRALKLDLANTQIGLAIIHTMLQIPFSVYLMRNSFEGVPRELEEAAVIDGCSSFECFRRVALPLVFPGIITIAPGHDASYPWRQIGTSDRSPEPGHAGTSYYLAPADKGGEPPDRWQPLQQRRTVHMRLQPFDLRVLLAHRSVLLSETVGRESSSFVLFRRPPFGNREAGAGQGRARHGSAQRDAPLSRAARQR